MLFLNSFIVNYYELAELHVITYTICFSSTKLVGVDSRRNCFQGRTLHSYGSSSGPRGILTRGRVLSVAASESEQFRTPETARTTPRAKVRRRNRQAAQRHAHRQIRPNLSNLQNAPTIILQPAYIVTTPQTNSQLAPQSF